MALGPLGTREKVLLTPDARGMGSLRWSGGGKSSTGKGENGVFVYHCRAKSHRIFRLESACGSSSLSLWTRKKKRSAAADSKEEVFGSKLC